MALPCESQRRAAHAWQQGYFKNSIVPVRDVLDEVVLDRDEFMRPDTTLEGLGKLKPSFVALGQAGFDTVALHKYPQIEAIEHVHTGGNSSGIVDGSAAVLLGNKRFGKTDRQAASRAHQGVRVHGIGADHHAERAGAHDAEAAEALRHVDQGYRSVRNQRGLRGGGAALHACSSNSIRSKVNVNGGAIAMGHPLGATGAMILGTVLDELERRNLNTALITLCAGNGLGTATIIERV